MPITLSLKNRLIKGIAYSGLGLVFAALISTIHGPWTFCLVFTFLWILPGLAWSQLFRTKNLDSVENLIIGLGLNFVSTPIITLFLSYLSGPVSRQSLIIAGTINIIFPLILTCLTNKIYIKKQSTILKTSLKEKLIFLWNQGWFWLIAALIIAANLRLVNLNYSEFQGDEATVMVRAAQALEGDENILFQHKKGPVELVIIMAGWRLTGMTNEWMARLPFSYAGLVGIATIFLIGKRLSSPSAGGLAALLMSINGFFVGFGRIVQYQSLILVFCTLGIFCLLCYQGKGVKRLAVLALIFFGTGALAHYDIILTMPAAIFLIFNRVWCDRFQLKKSLASLFVAGLIGIAVVGIYYIPFFKSGFIEFTSTYISGRIGGDKLFYNNTRSFFRLSAVYNAVYFVVCIFSIWLIKVISTWNRWGRWGSWLSALIIIISACALYKPKPWSSNLGSLVWIPLFLILAGAFLAPSQKAGDRALWLWFGVPTLFYLFFVAMPLTHIYTLYPALSILVALGLEKIVTWTRSYSRVGFQSTLLAAFCIYCLCGFYAIILFVDHDPEYIRDWPQTKNPLFWTPYSVLPDEGLFGFPYRAGWKVVGYLIDQGILIGSYDSNEEQDVTDYYTHRSLRLGCAKPDMYITAENVQDETPIPADLIQANYHPSINISSNGDNRLAIYLPNSEGTVSSLSVESFESLFDMKTTPSSIGNPVFFDFSQQIPDDYQPMDVSIGDIAKLLGFKIKDTHVTPGSYIELTLYWKSLSSTNKNYHVFTHLHDGQSMIGQLDGQPVCGQYPTSQWNPGQIIVDPYILRINLDAQTDHVIPLTVGMYDFQNMERAIISSSDGQVMNDHVFLTDIKLGGH